jgi:hypothetical protein
MSLTEKGFSGLLGKIQRAEGTMRSLVQEAVEDSIAYAIDRQDQGHGLDLRRLSTLQAATKAMKSINSQRLSDYIKTCLVDSDGKPCIGWNEKEACYKLLKKGTIASAPSIDTRGTWFDFGKAETIRDDFNFTKRLNALLAQAEKHSDKLSDADRDLIKVLRAGRTTITMGGLTPAEAAAAGV